MGLDGEDVRFAMLIFGSPGSGDSDDNSPNQINSLYHFFHSTMSFWLAIALFRYCISSLSVLGTLFNVNKASHFSVQSQNNESIVTVFLKKSSRHLYPLSPCHLFSLQTLLWSHQDLFYFLKLPSKNVRLIFPVKTLLQLLAEEVKTTLNCIRSRTEEY
jgi:hypothetical protein